MRSWTRLKRTLFGDRDAGEIRDELEFHLDMDVAAGHDRKQARRRLGNPVRIEDQTRAVRVLPWLDSVLRDIRHTLRQLIQAPVLTLAIVASLAIGIGANTAIFSLIDAAILKPLPVRDPGSLVLIEWTSDGFPPGVESLEGRARQTPTDQLAGSIYPEGFVRRLIESHTGESNTGLDAVFGSTGTEYTAVAIDGAPAERSTLQYVSWNFFRDLGVNPPLGRSFTADEDRPGAAPAVVVSYRFWASRLGQRPDALGRTITIDGVQAQVVGVAPRGFFGLSAGNWTDIYAPLATRVAFDPTGNGSVLPENRWWINLIGRLNPATSEAAVADRIESAFHGLVAEIAPGTDEASRPTLSTTSAARGFDTLDPRDVTALWILMVLVGVLLLIVCANVANLLLARALGMQHEAALRLALGASRGRLQQKSLIESGILAALGGLVGIALGYLLAHGIHELFQTGRDASNRFDLGIDARLLAWVFGLTLVTSLMFGLLPALRMTRVGLSDALRTRTRSVLGGNLRLPRMLVSAQLALCLAALMAASLFERTLGNLGRLDLGFDPDNLSYVSIDPWPGGHTDASIGPYLAAVKAELARLPGLDAVSMLDRRVLTTNSNVSPVSLPGVTASQAASLFDMSKAVYTHWFDDDALATLGIEMLDGRSWTDSDVGNGSNRLVVDGRFVERILGGGRAIGRRFILDGTEYEIMGVAGDVRWGQLREGDLPMVYMPYVAGSTLSASDPSPINIAIRSSLNPTELAAQVRAAIRSVDDSVAIIEFQTQQALINRLLRTERLLAFLSGGFGFWALALAAIGLGGLLTYAVTRRTDEIGIRMALGADRSSVVQMVLRDSLSMVAIGIVVGLPCAYGLAKLLESLLFELEPMDMGSMTFALAALSVVAFTAAWLPARRAARIDPLAALREQ